MDFFSDHSDQAQAYDQVRTPLIKHLHSMGNEYCNAPGQPPRGKVDVGRGRNRVME